MASPLLIGLGAGLVSAVLFASAATGSLLAMMLFYLAPLPSFLAGLGWGWASAGLAALSGTVVAGAALGFKAALSYLFGMGLPVVVLCYLALLAREVPQPAPAGVTGGRTDLEWYPPGRLVSWASVMAGTLAAASVPMLGMDVDSYRAAIHDVLSSSILRRFGGSELDEHSINNLVEVLARALPAASAMIWLGVAVFNMWAAGRIVDYSGRSLRPWPDITALAYPAALAFALVAALALSFVPGLIGIMATGFAGAFLLAYTLLGLAIVHVLTRNSPLRVILLASVYLSLFLFGWVALLLAILGVGEPIFKLRERVGNKTPPHIHRD